MAHLPGSLSLLLLGRCQRVARCISNLPLPRKPSLSILMNRAKNMQFGGCAWHLTLFHCSGNGPAYARRATDAKGKNRSPHRGTRARLPYYNAPQRAEKYIRHRKEPEPLLGPRPSFYALADGRFLLRDDHPLPLVSARPRSRNS